MRLALILICLVLCRDAYAWPWDSVTTKLMKTTACDYYGQKNLPNTSGKITAGGRIVVELSVIDDAHVEMRLLHYGNPQKLIAKVVETKNGQFELWILESHFDAPMMTCFW